VLTCLSRARLFLPVKKPLIRCPTFTDEVPALAVIYWEHAMIMQRLACFALCKIALACMRYWSFYYQILPQLAIQLHVRSCSRCRPERAPEAEFQ